MDGAAAYQVQNQDAGCRIDGAERWEFLTPRYLPSTTYHLTGCRMDGAAAYQGAGWTVQGAAAY